MVHLDVKLVFEGRTYHFERTEDGRVLTNRVTGKTISFLNEHDALEYANERGWLVTNGKTYVEAYRDMFYPDVTIYDSMPDGWHVIEGSTTAPNGAKWICNGPFFIRRANGKLARNNDHKDAWVLTN